MTEITNPRLLVIEYIEGCGYNARFSFEQNGETFEYWESRTPVNRAMMQQYIDRKMKQYPELAFTQEMIYSPLFTAA